MEKEFNITCVNEGEMMKVVVQAKTDDEAVKVFRSQYKDATLIMISSTSTL